MFCSRCGAALPRDAYTCPSCGSPVEGGPGYNNPAGGAPYRAYPEQKSKLVAGLLQIFVGSFGVGRFYLGYNSIAVAQILVSFLTCGIGALWPLIDGILILTGSVPTDANGVPLKD